MRFTSFVAIAALVAPVFSLAITDSSNGLVIDKREVQRTAAARIALAKARAARRTKRESTLDTSSTLTKRGSQLPRRRCTLTRNGPTQADANAFCAAFYSNAGVALAGGATPECIASNNPTPNLCAVTCPRNTYAQSSNTAVNCLPIVGSCLVNGEVQTCQSSPYGTVLCDPTEGCTANCLTRGYVQNPRNRQECISTQQLAREGCGPNNIICPPAYNSLPYAPTCDSGRCSITCPRGFKAYPVANSDLLNCTPN